MTDITKDELKKRLDLIEAQINQVVANLNMLLGAKEEINFWLKAMEVSEAPAQKTIQEIESIKFTEGLDEKVMLL